MDHAKTIAMARDLLADGRGEDVVQMTDPLLEAVEAPATSTGLLLLHALRAQVDVVHRDRPDKGLRRLPALSEVGDLCTCVRAEVALWRGWGRAHRAVTPDDTTRALLRLQHAEDLFESIHDPRGRGWALLGQVLVHRQRDEFGRMRRTLEEAKDLVGQRDDVLAERWVHELSIPALRASGHYDDAQRHLQALRTRERAWSGSRIRGHVTAYEAALRFDLGQSPSDVIASAETAETLLRQSDSRAPYPLVMAYRAHVGALIRQGRHDEARSVLDEAETTTEDRPDLHALLLLLRARLALRRDRSERAQAVLHSLLDHRSRLPHGLHWAPLARLRGEVLNRHNDLDAAYTWFTRAYRNARDTGHRGRELRALLMMARTAAARSDLDAARTHLSSADAHEGFLSVLPVAARRFDAEGTVAQAAGSPDEATKAYRHALAAATMIGDRYHTASLQLALAQTERDDRAHARAADARTTFEAIGATDEARVASALADGIADPAGPPSALSHPAPDDALDDILTRASLSVPLVAHAWLQAAAAQLDDRWVGVYRLSTDGIASLLHEHGTRPPGLHPPSVPAPDSAHGPAEWIPLRSSLPTLTLGIETTSDDDPDWRAARKHLRAQRPLLRLALERALLLQERSAAAQPPLSSVPVDGFVAESDAMQSVLRALDDVRTSAQPVLIDGEDGAGKRLLGRVVHATSPRADGPLKHVACNTMQRDPLPERLFGRVDGDDALTPGAVHKADGGTLLVEDVHALSPEAQDKLLQLLRTGTVVPVDSTRPSPVDVRVLATTDVDLDRQVRDDHFRPALRDRLAGLSLHMPPLRDRRADLPLLVHHFLDALRPDQIRAATGAAITQPAMEALLRYDWPGNVRQLRNEIERALVYVENEPVQTIDRDVLSTRIVEAAQAESPASVDAADAILHPDRSLDDVLSETETAVIERVLKACEGQVTASAEVLGLSRQGLYKKMKRLGIDASDFHPDPEPAPASS
jgi:DNA-binding NtrC family response regulator/predicted negative regulator of RcsB-dependent stress response